MKQALLIPTDNENFLTTNIAGLKFAERLLHLTRKSSISHILILGKKPENFSLERFYFIENEKDFSQLELEEVIVLKNGYLPDLDLLKTLANHRCKTSFTVEDFDSIFLLKLETESVKKFFSENVFESIFDSIDTKIKIATGKLYDISGKEAIKKTTTEMFRSLIKDTEGFMSRHFERKISLSFSKILVHTPITPNQMTIVSIVIGIVGAIMIALQKGTWQIIGSFLFLAHSILDGCDGEIARIKFQESRWGGLLDFWGDNIVHAAIFSAIAWEWYISSKLFLPVTLGFFAVFGTFASATIIYRKTMRTKKEGPLYTSVSGDQEKNKITQIADFLSRRDFIYLVIILAFFQKLNIFLWWTAIGAPIFFFVILFFHITAKDKTAHAEK